MLAINGSSGTGRCSDAFESESIIVCEAVTSSVLFDGLIPTLNLSSHTWASQLFVVHSSVNLFIILRQDNTLLSRLELAMFNCPEWGIAVQSISVSVPGEIGVVASTTTTNITSCDDLVTVSLPVPNMQYIQIQLHFALLPGSQSMSIAEVKLYGGVCLQSGELTSTTTQSPSKTFFSTCRKL